MTEIIRRVDQNRVKFAHAMTFTLLIIAFIFDAPLLVLFVAWAQLLGALDVPFAPYRVLYDYVARPSGLFRQNLQIDSPEPHHFASLVGGLFDLIGFVALVAGLPVLGWMFVWVVIILANLNVWISFCMGCWMYYQFNRIGVPGFTHAQE